ncbi:MAG TPA: hydrogenase 4 subunit B [Methanomassiliicoccales archaeon]|nr:hydrogenase 4 subunit B [Methanomassiliicoccales archaeon]
MDSNNLFYILLALALFGAPLAAALNNRPKISAAVAFGASAMASLVGLIIGADVLLNGPMRLDFPFSSPFGTFAFAVDGLSALFIIIISLVTFAVSIYSLGYVRHYYGKYPVGLMGSLFNIFYVSMIMVVSSSNAILFLIMWETMSLSSYFLVIFESREKGTVASGLFYLIMTHIGTAAITIGFILMYSESGSFEFSSFHGAALGMSDLLRSSVFALWLVGFGTKAGIIPFHTWLPMAHPAAPSNISSLMSAVMVKTAIYMLIRCYFGFLGVQDAWWGVIVLAVACVSALLGVMYALIESDIKRMLAFSTVENIGIILMALGVAMIFQSYGLKELAALALIAALMHVLSHALFKSLLFMGAGSVLYAAHTRNMEKLGGLAKRMPYTSLMFFIGVLSIAAIPPLTGFVSEWLIFQSMLQSFNIPDAIVKILIPVALGTLAITGALAAAAFLKAYGITFLARPRSEEAERAEEVPRTMLVGMGILSALCILAGVLSFMILPVMDDVTSPLVGVSIGEHLISGFLIVPTVGEFSQMSPLLIGVLLTSVFVGVLAITHLYGGRRKVVRADTWDCGTPLTSRTEYSGRGFSNPINRMFSWVYHPLRVFRSTSHISPYVKSDMRYTSTIEPVFERYFYEPMEVGVRWLARKVSVIQTGSIQTYLGYIFVVLILLLVVLR